MRFIHTVQIRFEEQEVQAWNIIFEAICQMDRLPCEDEDASNAISNLHDAMVDFIDYCEQ